MEQAPARKSRSSTEKPRPRYANAKTQRVILVDHSLERKETA